MADDLRMKAEVTDHASGPLRRIREELGAFRETEGMKSLKESMTVLREQTAEFTKASAGAGNVMGGIGVGSLAASVSVGELIRTFKELAERTADLRALSKETGLTVDAINQLEHVAERFHVSPEKMGAALGVLADKMVDFRRHTGDLFGELNQQRPDIAKRLLGENPQQQVDEILKFLDTIKNSGVRKRWAEAFFGDGDIARLVQDGYGKFAEEQAEAAKNVPKLTAEYQRQAEAFNQSILSFNDSMEKLETSTGPFLFKQLRATADEFRGIFDDVTKAIEWIKGEQGKSAGEVIHDAGKAGHTWIEQQHEINEARRKAGNGPIIDLPGAVLGPNADIRSEDGNALHRNDEMPTSPKGSSWLGRLFGGSVQKSSFDTFGGSSQTGSGFGFQDILQRATRAGVTQGLQDYADLTRAQAAGGGGGGIQNASYTTYGSGGSGRAGGGGSSLDLSGLPTAKGNAATQEHIDFIRERAKALGIDPNYALRVAGYEGLGKAHAGGDKGTSFGDYQMHYKNNIPGLSLGGLGDMFNKETGLDGKDPKNWRQLDDYALRYASKHGWNSWHGATGHNIHGMMGIGRPPGDGARAGGASYSGHIGGQLAIGGESFRFGSGGVHGSSSIPMGDYPITPDAIGAWGKANDALGINGNKIYDEALGRMRTGIEMHAGHSAALITEGCLAFERSQWPKVKQRVMEMIHREGRAFLHVGKDGASVTSRPSFWERNKAAAGGGDQTVKHTGSAEVTIKGLPNGASAHTKTEGLISKVKLHRSTTMPELSWNA